MVASESLVLPLAFVGDSAIRLLLAVLLGDEDGLREDLGGVRKGSSSSSKSMAWPVLPWIAPSCTLVGLASSSLRMWTGALRLTREDTDEKSGKGAKVRARSWQSRHAVLAF